MEMSFPFSGNGDFPFVSLFLALIVTLVCCFVSLLPFRLLKFSQSDKTKACNCACSNSKGFVGATDSMAVTATARMMNGGGGGGQVVMVERERQQMIGASMMEQLVPEITTHALSYLDYPSLCRLSMTNSSMRRAANDDNAWKALYHKVIILSDFSQNYFVFRIICLIVCCMLCETFFILGFELQ